MYLFEELLKEKEAEGRLDATEYEIDYGDRAEHCWNVRTVAGLATHARAWVSQDSERPSVDRETTSTRVTSSVVVSFCWVNSPA